MKRFIYLAAALAAGGAGYVAWLQSHGHEVVDDPQAERPCPEGQAPCIQYGWECVGIADCPL